jgi:hypothetical protein
MKVGPTEGCICMNHAMSIALCIYVQWSGLWTTEYGAHKTDMLATKNKKEIKKNCYFGHK